MDIGIQQKILFPEATYYQQVIELSIRLIIGNRERCIAGIHRVAVRIQSFNPHQAILRRGIGYNPTKAAVIGCGRGCSRPGITAIGRVLDKYRTDNAGIGPGDVMYGPGCPTLAAVGRGHGNSRGRNNGKQGIADIKEFTVCFTDLDFTGA